MGLTCGLWQGGGFFFWSIDRRFMVKTLEPVEYANLKGLLPRYYGHMWRRFACEPRSPRPLGDPPWLMTPPG